MAASARRQRRWLMLRVISRDQYISSRVPGMRGECRWGLEVAAASLMRRDAVRGISDAKPALLLQCGQNGARLGLDICIGSSPLSP